jgi:hypothetical protein
MVLQHEEAMIIRPSVTSPASASTIMGETAFSALCVCIAEQSTSHCQSITLSPGLLIATMHNAVSGRHLGQERDAKKSHALARWPTSLFAGSVRRRICGPSRSGRIALRCLRADYKTGVIRRICPPETRFDSCSCEQRRLVGNTPSVPGTAVRAVATRRVARQPAVKGRRRPRNNAGGRRSHARAAVRTNRQRVLRADGTRGRRRGMVCHSNSGSHGLTRTLSPNWRATGVLPKVVMPGLTLTETVVATVPEHVRQRVSRETPGGTPFTPCAVASTIVFLCSEASRGIIGEVVRVSGGWR